MSAHLPDSVLLVIGVFVLLGAIVVVLAAVAVVTTVLIYLAAGVMHTYRSLAGRP